METNDWIEEVNKRLGVMPNLAEGGWRGYMNDGYSSIIPVRGRYILYRWREPNIVVAHDDKEEAFRLADRIEKLITDSGLYEERFGG